MTDLLEFTLPFATPDPDAEPVQAARALSQSPNRLTPMETHQLQYLVGHPAEEPFLLDGLDAELPVIRA